MSYAPWRGVFYPKGLKQADELAYAASHLTSIEINATHYRLQSAKSFKSWAQAAPDGFVFSVKGPRLVTNHKLLAETGNFIKRFFASGLAELGDKLGPVLWQFAAFKRFAERTQCLGRMRDALGKRRLAGGPSPGRSRASTRDETARRVHLFHPRRQAARTGRGDGADRAPGLTPRRIVRRGAEPSQRPALAATLIGFAWVIFG